MASTDVSGLTHGPRRPARRFLIMCGYHRFRLFQALGLAFLGTNICKLYFIVFLPESIHGALQESVSFSCRESV
jgi:hypothetical protein